MNHKISLWLLVDFLCEALEPIHANIDASELKHYGASLTI